MIFLAHFLAKFVNNPYGIIPFLEWNLYTISLKMVFMLTLKMTYELLNVVNDYSVKNSLLTPLTNDIIGKLHLPGNQPGGKARDMQI